MRAFCWPLLRRALDLALAVTAAATLLGFGSRWSRLADLASSFRVQYCWILLAGALLLALERRWRWATPVFVLAILNAALWLPLYRAPPAMPTEGVSLRIVSANVYSANQRRDELLQFIRAERPDLLLLMEVTGHWQPLIDELADILPHRQLELRPDNFGIALLSRQPLAKAEIQYLGPAEVPSVVANVDWAGGKFTLIGTHPLPPMSGQLWDLRNAQLRAVADLVHTSSGPAVVVGDLNTTSWSHAFSLIADGTRLRDSRPGFGVQASWPQWLAIGRIPIDHCLVSPEFVVRQRRIGPDIGSDHRPLVIDLELADEEGAADDDEDEADVEMAPAEKREPSKPDTRQAD